MQRRNDGIAGKVPLSFDGTGFDERGGIAVYPDPSAVGLDDLKAALAKWNCKIEAQLVMVNSGYKLDAIIQSN